MTPTVGLLLFLATSPFLLLPSILAFAARRRARFAILAINVALWLVGLLSAFAGVPAGAIGLLPWLGLLVWASRGKRVEAPISG